MILPKLLNLVARAKNAIVDCLQNRRRKILEKKINGVGSKVGDENFSSKKQCLQVVFNRSPKQHSIVKFLVNLNVRNSKSRQILRESQHHCSSKGGAGGSTGSAGGAANADTKSLSCKSVDSAASVATSYEGDSASTLSRYSASSCCSSSSEHKRKTRSSSSNESGSGRLPFGLRRKKSQG